MTPKMCTYRLPTSITKNTYRRLRVSAQSTWKKSHASRGLRLRSEELAPGGVVTALRRRWYAQAVEDTTDCGGADPVTEAA